MRRVHAYVTVYEDHQLATVIARERYYQQWLDAHANLKGERTILADYLLLQLPNEDWVPVRDVYEVDGTAVADRAGRRNRTSAPSIGGRRFRLRIGHRRRRDELIQGRGRIAERPEPRRRWARVQYEVPMTLSRE